MCYAQESKIQILAWANLDMGSLLFIFLLLLVADGILVPGSMNITEINFNQNYEVTRGDNHVMSLNQGKEIQLTMDNSSVNFTRKKPYDELDFEFLGNRKGKPYRLQTNTAKGIESKEFRLWFDPTADFHNYRILWNQHQIVVYKNKTNIGVGYPSKPMQIEASLWDGDSWAKKGGKTKTDWSYTSFKASFQGFDYWWNTQKYWQLDPVRQRQYERVKHKYMTYI
ncbi:Xyloglucan endotransglucosylase/hydrolase protein 2 [Glycine max]|nr:Xyloglucan endotransglucosylase/hydrolase protein 2 [Glycine max]